MDPDAYDGFGAPIYHQEDTMPTNLPDDFKGTGKPGQIQTGDGSWIDIEPNTDDGPDGARNYDGHPILDFIVTAMGYAIGAALTLVIFSGLLWLALAILTHLPRF